MKMTLRAIKIRAAFAATLSFAGIMAFYALPASSQPPAGGPGGASGRGRGGGGGGFTHAAKEDFNDHDGFVSLFDGKTLAGWDGDPNLWSVRDGSIYINPTCEHPTGTVYIVWQGGEVRDFDLKLEMKGTGSINSGIQYRSWITGEPGAPTPPGRGGGAGGPGGGGRGGSGGRGPGGGSGGFASGGGGRGNAGPCPSGQPRGTAPDRASQAKWDMGGYQYDFDNNGQYPGQLYEQSTGRGIITWMGEVVETREGKPKQLLASLGDTATVKSWFNKDDWNTEEIIASGNTLTHLLNGHLLSVTIDNEKSRARDHGKIGIEVESTGEVFVRNIWLKKD
jgi:hypothetical protein